MRIRQAAAKCNLSALRRGLRWRWERGRGRRRQGWALGWGCLSSSDAAPRGTVWFTVNRRLKKTQKRDREREWEKRRGREEGRGGRNLNVISKKWIKNLCGGTKQPIEGWFIAQGRRDGAVAGFGFTKLSCNTGQVFIYAPQSESQREEV